MGMPLFLRDPGLGPVYTKSPPQLTVVYFSPEPITEKIIFRILAG
jgi:hypothetical protein